jgi:hypothetical protein
MALFRYIARLYLWMLRIALPLTLVVMLALPVLLDPPEDMAAAACATRPDATVVPIGGGDAQYTFLRLQAPLLVVVERQSNGAIVTEENRAGMWLWLSFLVLLTAATLWIWWPRRITR